MDEQKKNPALVFKNLKLGESIEMVLNCARPIATGESQYGQWNLWSGNVTNASVTEGRGVNAKIVDNYTGETIFFPSAKLHENLIGLANGNIEVKVKITKNAKETQKGLITTYDVEKLSDGRLPDSSITPTETRLINEATELIQSGHDMPEHLFIKASQEPQYENKISEEKAKTLYKMVNK